MKNFTPDQVRRMSLTEIRLAIEGFQEFNGGERANASPTQEEARALFEQIERGKNGDA
jgi:hypothetical protein